MNITNPKAIFIDGVWCIVDAPERPDDNYNLSREAVPKATRWKVKEQEEIEHEVFLSDVISLHKRYEDWQPEEGRVYDLPAGKLKFDWGELHENTYPEILFIPEEEVKDTKPFLDEKFTDNGAHDYWSLIDPITGKELWNDAEGAKETKLIFAKEILLKLWGARVPKIDQVITEDEIWLMNYLDNYNITRKTL